MLPDTVTTRKWPQFPYVDVIEQRLARSGKKPAGDTLFATDLPNKCGTHVELAFISPDSSSFERLTVARRLVTRQLEHDPRSIAFYSPGFNAEINDHLAEAIVAASLACTSVMPEFKSSRKKPARLGSIVLYGLGSKADFKRTLAEAAGNSLARQLTTLPPNELTPLSMTKSKNSCW